MTWWQWLAAALGVCAVLVVWLVCATLQTFITKPDERRLQVPPKEGR
ncbi:MAG: hypothetical protein WC565_05010 [Parcubacteria group bacterium]